jgi:amino acid transporter
MKDSSVNKKSFGTAPVFFTAISTILGAILFLRFGFAVGTLGFLGVLLILLVGHMVTIPTALALSEIATNEKVEGGGEYFIISRSFGLNIGATIGISLFFSQAISVAFYVIAFTEAFEPLFNLFRDRYNIMLPRQVISLPAMTILSFLILKKGANLGVKALYFVVAILFISLTLFFLGETEYSQTSDLNFFSGSFRNMSKFFVVFAIVFPAFTGMTAGVGLSGDLKKPGRSIPLGTISATIIGMIIYLFISWKLNISASPDDLIKHQLIMSKVALYGTIIIPFGLAASTISSALGSVMVAPRTLQALGVDRSFPSFRLNSFIARGKGETNEPFNGSFITCIIAFIFVALGSVNVVAEIISMFFMVTYGSICLISFLYHFGADPSYRPSFRSKWFLSLLGFIMCTWLMFKINTFYALVAFVLMTFIYIFIHYYHRERQGIETIFQGAIFQLSRNLQVFLQKSKKISTSHKWRPSMICISQDSFERDNAFKLLTWVSHRYGFGTYIHFLEGYYSKSAHQEAKNLLAKLIEKSEDEQSRVFIDTIISPSYTSAIAQVIQLPSISGMDNNMILFEFLKNNPVNLAQIIDNYALSRAGDYDVCVLGSSGKKINYKNGIHVWIRSHDYENANLMILLSYIILGHPDWKKGKIKIFDVCDEAELDQTRKNLVNLVSTGRLPISEKNIEILKKEENVNIKNFINEKSADAGLTLIGFRGEQLKHDKEDLFNGYDKTGNILFVNARQLKIIN